MAAKSNKKSTSANAIVGSNPSYTRPEVVELTPRWDMIRDCISGQEAIKFKTALYLPKPNPDDQSAENKQRYLDYLNRAVFYNATARTVKGLVGQVFARDPILTIPAPMDVFKVDCDGGGLPMDQFARMALAGVISYGRCGILTDYPNSTIPATADDVKKGKRRPTLTYYNAWNVVNWRTMTVGAEKLLSLVVLFESRAVADEDNGFSQSYKSYWRVLALDANGDYISQLWYYDTDEKTYYSEDPFYPTDAKGQRWKFIPFTFIGSENNESSPDNPPMYDIAVLNVGHYRNSADYEEAVYCMGQPTLVITGLTEQWVKQVLKNKPIQVGSRAAVALPSGAGAELLQAQPNILAKEAMEQKEDQMKSLGAKLIETTQEVARTATEVGIEEASTTSLLATSAKNVSHGLTQALKWAANFFSVSTYNDDSVEYELNTEFDIARLDPTTIQQLIAAWQANAITIDELRDNFKRGGIAYEDTDAYLAAINKAGKDLSVPVGSPASTADAQMKANAAKAIPASDNSAKGTPAQKP